ncbi:MAG: hypothetical protein E7108_08650 [Bacteroidales bacterium]|jgi:serine phosphatase RsbU (regulator of sigma subunit)|nr:hypothetical protein [Bacteroidales bacterium]
MTGIIVISDTTKLSANAQIGMKEIEIKSYKMIIRRREKIIEERNRQSAELSAATKQLIASTNKLRRELVVAEAELRQLQNGIINN